MKRRKRIIWWESGVAARRGPSRNRAPQYDEWARHHIDGFEPEAHVAPPRPRAAGPIPERLQTLGEALTRTLSEQGHSVPQAGPRPSAPPRSSSSTGHSTVAIRVHSTTRP